ncbi:unnamed protein product, partial [marine sediment metagenome]
ITFANASIKVAGSDLDPNFTFAAEISNGDYVGLHVDTGNTPAATGLLPVVTCAAATAPIIGRVINEPEWSNAPQATADTWADMLTAGHYRTATVEFFTVTGAHSAFIEGDTADVLVGAPLLWNLTLDAWLDAGTTFTGAFSFHYNASDVPLEGLIGFGTYAAGSGDTDCAGSDVIA